MANKFYLISIRRYYNLKEQLKLESKYDIDKPIIDCTSNSAKQILANEKKNGIIDIYFTRRNLTQRDFNWYVFKYLDLKQDFKQELKQDLFNISVLNVLNLFLC